MNGSIYLQYGNLLQPVFFKGCANITELLEEISRGVDIQRIELVQPIVPQIIISRAAYSYIRESAWLAAPVVFKDPIDAVCDLTVDLMHGLVGSIPGALCFHCAAVEFGDGLYILPVTYRGGKSLLSAYLCYLGACLYTDDALLITPDQNAGMATGLLPRIRLPLPDNLNESFRNFVRDRSSIRNMRYCYLKLNDSELVPYGTISPIKGIIMLKRESTCDPVLKPAQRKTVIKEIILRNFARETSPTDIVDRVTSLVDNSDCYHLTYQDVESGANLLMKRFGSP
ncbi:hypothetical protein [Desulfopila sp. IMCC35008]|uniref:hypothetical protein n=1 Tax=Desulfopila sp. IMCC35008 TaxID=2653858 RepID=UPI0013D0B946|nr:hypothetical protein [Desulfopila sp. IMCC35008]